MLKDALKFTVTIHTVDTYTDDLVLVFSDNTTTDNFMDKIVKALVNTLKDSFGFYWSINDYADTFEDFLSDRSLTMLDIEDDYTLREYIEDTYIDEMLQHFSEEKFESYDQLTDICDFIDDNSNASVDWIDFTVTII